MPTDLQPRPRGRPRSGDSTDGRSFQRIGGVARETGLTPRAIRHYEAIGLLRPAARFERGNRLYDPDDVDRLRDIRRLRDVLGFSLAEIGELLERSREIVVRRLAIVEAKLAQLRTFHEEESARLARLDERLGRPASLV